MNLYESIKSHTNEDIEDGEESLKESAALFGINTIRKIIADSGLDEVEESSVGSRAYTFSGLYKVAINEHFNNILFESYDLPIHIIVSVLKSGKGADTRITGYSIVLRGFVNNSKEHEDFDVVGDISIYTDEFTYVAQRLDAVIKDYAEYITYSILKALEKNKTLIDEPEKTSIKNGLYTEIALSKFIAVVRDFIDNKNYAPTNVNARLDDTQLTGKPMVKDENYDFEEVD